MSHPSIVFVAGSRQISRLPAEVRSRLDTMIEKGFQILVGDANGADKAVQRQRSSYFKAPMKSAALVSMALLVTMRISGQTATPGEEARRAVQAFYEAYNAHEFDQLTKFTTEDWTHIAPNGIVRRGRSEAVQSMKQAHATFLKDVADTPEDIAVRLATDDVAIVTVRSRTSTFTTPNGVTHENEIRIRTFVVVKRDGRWLIMQDQNTARSGPA